jgi:hypothetical protein
VLHAGVSALVRSLDAPLAWLALEAHVGEDVGDGDGGGTRAMGIHPAAPVLRPGRRREAPGERSVGDGGVDLRAAVAMRRDASQPKLVRLTLSGSGALQGRRLVAMGVGVCVLYVAVANCKILGFVFIDNKRGRY